MILLLVQSTGSIIGSIFVCKSTYSNYTPDVYRQHEDYFTNQNPWWKPWRRFTRPTYDRECVVTAMKQCLDEIGISKFGELSVKFVSTAVNVCSKENVLFKSTSEKYKDRLITDIVKYSFAALIFWNS